MKSHDSFLTHPTLSPLYVTIIKNKSISKIYFSPIRCLHHHRPSPNPSLTWTVAIGPHQAPASLHSVLHRAARGILLLIKPKSNDFILPPPMNSLQTPGTSMRARPELPVQVYEALHDPGLTFLPRPHPCAITNHSGLFSIPLLPSGP